MGESEGCFSIQKVRCIGKELTYISNVLFDGLYIFTEFLYFVGQLLCT